MLDARNLSTDLGCVQPAISLVASSGLAISVFLRPFFLVRFLLVWMRDAKG
jgi:hypothetical protein